MTFGEKLQRLRQREGLSQDQLAELLGISRQAVSRWERDETLPETATVVRLAEIFHVTTDYLLRKREPDETQKPETPSPGTYPQTGGDTVSRLGRLAKTKGYLLGWVLIVWGAADFVKLLVLQFAWGSMTSFMGDLSTDGLAAITTLPVRSLGIFGIYGVIKIIAGVLVLHYGKRYAKSWEGEE